ncbi:MAG: tetratricopeptide repeat protein [Rhizomicrobium sp.]
MTQQLLGQAVALHQRGQLAEAEPLYRQVLAAGTESYQAQYLLAVLLFQQQRLAEAAPAVEAALKLSPDAVESLLLKGVILQALGRGEDALSSLAAVTSHQPAHPEAWYNQGVVLAGLGRQEEAIAAFDRALALRPGAAVWTNRGAALKALGRSRDALESYDRALALEPDFPAALYNRGVVLLDLERFAEAVIAFDQALAKVPGNHDAWNNRGVALDRLDQFAQALESYDRCLALRSDDARAWKNRGTVLTRLKRFDEAVASFDRAVSHGLGPDVADALSGRGDVLRHRERFDEAIASYDRALALAPDNADAWSNRAACLQVVRRFEEAAVSVNRALALAPGHIHALAVRGSQLCETGQFAQGVESYRHRAGLAHGGSVVTQDGDPDFKQRHDAEQRDYLAAQGIRVERFHIADGEELAGAAVNPVNASAIAAQWAGSDPKIAVIDNLLTPDALEGLRRFCWGSTIWKKPYPGGYLGAMPDHGFACPLLAQIAEELRQVFPTIFGNLGLGQWWGFKYDSSLSGIRIHADQAAVNVNFWITPDEANCNPDNGGLVIWNKKPPLDWNSLRSNGDEKAARDLLAQTGAEPVIVPYRANRAVIFDSDLFHETDHIEFKPGYLNRRINVTMLYGRRGG